MINKFNRAPRLAPLDEVKLIPPPIKDPVSQSGRLFDNCIHTNTLF